MQRLVVEKEQQELAHHQRLTAVEAKQKECLEYFDLAAEANREKDATLDSVPAEKGEWAAEKESLAAQLDAECKARLHLEADAQRLRILPPAPPSLAAMRGHDAISVGPFGDVNSRAANWARSIASSSVKTARIDALQQEQQDMKEGM